MTSRRGESHAVGNGDSEQALIGPMSGIRVVEIGFWVAAPSAAGILSDWGADVIKIEPPGGDPMRSFMRGFLPPGTPATSLNPHFDLDNRGKRSVCLNLDTDRGRVIAHDLIDRADVLVTNIRSEALQRHGLDYEALSKRNPRLVYLQVTGYGTQGPDADRAAFDVGAFWARAGLAASLMAEGAAPPTQRPGMGDHLAGVASAGGIAAALFARERTGRGQLVSTSLLRVGAYMLSSDLSINLRTGAPTHTIVRETFPNPLFNSYRTADGRWFWLICLQSDRHWPDLVRSTDRQDLLEDERFKTAFDRARNAAELIAILDEEFSKFPTTHWAQRFDREGVWWAPVQRLEELAADPQAEGAGLFVTIPLGDNEEVRTVATPLDFSESRGPLAAPPELGEHTHAVLAELGIDAGEIDVLEKDGVIPAGATIPSG